jgi:hypothetical protein
MIRLDNPQRSLKATLAGAATTQPDVVVCFNDKTTRSFPPIKSGTALSKTNSTNAVTICPAPANLTIREVDSVFLKNNDASLVTATINYNDDGSDFELVTIEVGPSETLFYTMDSGWKVMDSNGRVKL